MTTAPSAMNVCDGGRALDPTLPIDCPAPGRTVPLWPDLAAAPAAELAIAAGLALLPFLVLMLVFLALRAWARPGGALGAYAHFMGWCYAAAAAVMVLWAGLPHLGSVASAMAGTVLLLALIKRLVLMLAPRLAWHRVLDDAAGAETPATAPARPSP
ncbi:MAG: hypothetical protein AAF677_09120 [Pseudomonadota bacterium]